MDLNEIKVGDTICISDVTTLDSALKQKIEGAMDGIEFTVKSIHEYEFENNINLTIFKFDKIETLPDMLVVFNCEEETDFRMMQTPKWFCNDIREYQISRHENYFMFKQPEDTENFDPEKLEYTEEFDVDGFVYNFIMANYGKDSEDNFVSLQQYNGNDDKCILIFETGQRNGFIELLEGYFIKSSDIELFINDTNSL